MVPKAYYSKAQIHIAMNITSAVKSSTSVGGLLSGSNLHILIFQIILPFIASINLIFHNERTSKSFDRAYLCPDLCSYLSFDLANR